MLVSVVFVWEASIVAVHFCDEVLDLGEERKSEAGRATLTILSGKRNLPPA